MREALRIDLNLTEMPGEVRPRLQVYALSESGPASDRDLDEPVHQIFEQIAGRRLLILGDPGTGKTNLLLELAGSLIEDALRDPELPIPIVFSLPRWTIGKKTRTIREWMIDDLVSEYQVSRETAASLLAQKDQLLPLLDGLDEVAAERRQACVHAVNAFQQERDLGWIAVCCRAAEYGELPQLDLRTAIRVQRMARSDVEREIAKPQMEAARRALDEDPELWKVIDTPLWLHVLYGAAQVEKSPGRESGDPRHRLYTRYVEYALSRDPDGAPRKRTQRDLLLRWMGWLATQMRDRNQSLFALEDLNANWLPKSTEHGYRRVLLALLFGVYFAITFQVIFLPFEWLLDMKRAFYLFPLAFGLPFGVLVGGRFATYDAVEELHFSLRLAPWLWALCAGIGLLWALSLWHLQHTLFAASVGLLGGFLLGMFYGGMQSRSVGKHSGPNLGTLRSLRTASIFAAAGMALALLARFLMYSHFPQTILLLHLLGGATMLVVLMSFIDGGNFVLQHYGTRALLRKQGAIPFRMVRFLNECSERLFLVRLGGSYEFFHITFRDYLAKTYGPTDPRLSRLGLQRPAAEP